jgi:hypothetical protein
MKRGTQATVWDLPLDPTMFMPATASPKKSSLELIRRLRDDVSYEDIMYELQFLQKVERGLKDVEEGRTASHAEVKDEFSKWLSEDNGWDPVDSRGEERPSCHSRVSRAGLSGLRALDCSDACRRRVPAWAIPRSGRVVPELQLEDYREVIVASYRIVYLTHGDQIDVLTITHGRQDLEKKISRR